MKEFCENEHCENPGFKVVSVSVAKPSDQTRTLCAACEEAYSIGVQHGTITAHQELAVRYVEKLMAADGFVVLGLNQSDPSRHGACEAWAYRGPLDFDVATPVVFGLGPKVRDALIALDLELADPKLGRRGTRRHGSGRNIAIEIDDRELATILVALRYHQGENLAGGEGIVDQAIQEIATDGGRLKPLTSGEIDRLCQRFNAGSAPKAGLPERGLTVEPPHKDSGSEPLFRVVYAIDVNASNAHEAAKAANQTMTDPAAMPPVLQVIDQGGAVTTIDLSEKESLDKKGGGP